MNDGTVITTRPAKGPIHKGIRTALLELGSATKLELSQKLGLSIPTVTKCLESLLADGEILSLGLDVSSGGRRAERYAYNLQYRLGLALFLERTGTHYSLFNFLGEAVVEGSAPSFLKPDFEGLVAFLEERIAACPQIGSISIGVPAPVSNGRVIPVPGVHDIPGFDLKSDLEERFSIPVTVENDMNAAVLGFHHGYRSPDNPTLIYLYFGTLGPGAGVMVNGDVVRGSTFFSGEVSFIPQYDRMNFSQALAAGGPSRPAFLTDEGVDAISRLVATFVAILNPHAVIFSNEEIKEPVLERVRERSQSYVPGDHLPELLTGDWKHDYLKGLQCLGLKLLNET